MPRKEESKIKEQALPSSSSRPSATKTKDTTKNTSDPDQGSEAVESKGSVTQGEGGSHQPGVHQSNEHKPQNDELSHSSNSNLQGSHPQSEASQSNTLDETTLHPYDPTLRMEVLTNEALLMMVGEWSKYPMDASGVHPEVHLHVGSIKEEMVKRGIIDEGWTYLVNLDSLDISFQRVKVEDARS